jgi:hypothetical protein
LRSTLAALACSLLAAALLLGAGAAHAALIIRTLDSAGDVGDFPSLKLNASGFPVIAYYDWDADDLKLAVCGDATCATVTITHVDIAGVAGRSPSLELLPNGNPVISYYDVTNSALKLAACSNPTCTAATLNTVVDAGRVGDPSSLELNASGFPVIAYYDGTQRNLELAVCGDATCATHTNTIVDATGRVGEFMKLQLNASGNPVIAYWDKTTRDLNLAVCGDATCTTKTITTVDSTGQVGRYAKLQLNASGFPVIAYYDDDGDNLKVAVCNDATCTTPTITVVDSAGLVGRFAALQLSASGFPIIAYFDDSNRYLKLAVCGDATCTTSTITVVDPTPESGFDVALRLDAAGSPVLAYYNFDSGDLKFAIYTAPTVASLVRAGANPTAAASVDFTVTFSEPVTGVDATDFAIAATGVTGAFITGVSGGPTTYTVTVNRGTGSGTLGLNLVDDNSIKAVLMSVPLGGAAAGDGNFTGETYTIDLLGPVTTSVAVPVADIYTAGQHLDFTVNWNEAAIVTGTPQIALTIGAVPRNASYLSGSGTAALVFRYTVVTGDNDSNGITVGALSLNGGTIRDGLANDATLTLNGVGSTASVLVDTTLPGVTSVGVPGAANYVTGQNLDFTVNWNETVIVTGTPLVPLTVGAVARNAAYVSGSGTATLLFRYTVVAGDNDQDGIAVGTDIVLNGGTIKGVADNPATTVLSGVGPTGGVRVNLTHVVTPSAGANGAISPNTPQTVANGGTKTFTATPNTGYTTAWAGSTCPGTPSGNTFVTAAITASCGVAATFTLNTYTVTPSAGANGAISPNTPQTVPHGGTRIFTATHNPGYSTAWTGSTCPGTPSGNTFTTAAITANCSVAVTFTLNSYTVTSSGGANGTITPLGAVHRNHGATAVFTVTPTATYSASVNGTCGGNLVGNTYTTNPITGACTVIAAFSQNTFTVTPSAGPNGAISPSTPQTVVQNGTKSFTVTPNAGYTAAVGGTCGGTLTATTYTTNAITGDCTVAATFTQNTYTVTSSAGANGTISPLGASPVNHGATAVFTLTPNADYSESVGGTCGGTLVGNTYTTNPITGSCTVIAFFALDTFKVTPSAGANGTISPSTPQTVVQNGTESFTVTPNPGHTAAVGGTCGGTLTGTTYTTNAVIRNCSVSATFSQASYTVTPSSGPNGTMTPLTPQTVGHDGTATFTVTPSAGYVAEVGGTCDGALTGTTYTTDAITGSCTVSASFSPEPVRTFTGPTATGSGTATVSFTGGGDSCAFAPQGDGPLQSAFFIPVADHPKSPPAGSAPEGVAFSEGLLDFVLLNCTPGSTIAFTVTYPSAIDPDASYWKYGPEPGNPTPHWYVLPAVIAGNTVTFSITDGGLGDDDLVANGVIVDQGGPGVPPPPIPTLGMGALVVLSLALLAFGAHRLRRTRSPGPVPNKER